MEGENCKESVVDVKCKTPGTVHKKNVETKFETQTPEKTSDFPLQTKSWKAVEFEHQDRYITILEIFECIISALRLLGLRNKLPTFQNIRTLVEVMTHRKLSHQHLAQMKYILPEALQIEKILIHDKKTLCMKPEMTIILSFDVVEGHSEYSDFIALHHLFASRLVNHFTVHPEVDIPQATLPDPFSKSNQSACEAKAVDSLEPSLAHSSVEDQPIPTEIELVSRSRHLHPLFSRHFSQKVFDVQEENTELLASPLPLISGLADNLAQDDNKIECHKVNKDVKIISVDIPETGFQPLSLSNLEREKAKGSPCKNAKSTATDPTSDQSTNIEFPVDVSVSQSSPFNKIPSSVDALVIATPAQSIPKRLMLSCDDKQMKTACQSTPSSYVAAKRVLHFSCSDSGAGSSELLEPLHDNITQAVETSTVLLQKVEESVTSPFEDPIKDQFRTVHQQGSFSLADLVSQICSIFQSKNYSPITKEELVYKLVINSLDFSDRGEVEEQIEILEKQVPDWICKKLAASGDILYNIKKTSDLDSILATVTNK